jgi:hypothetical protein
VLRLVKHLALMATDPSTCKLWEMYAYEGSRSGVVDGAPSASPAAPLPLSAYHLNCHTVLDDTCYRIEYRCVRVCVLVFGGWHGCTAMRIVCLVVGWLAGWLVDSLDLHRLPHVAAVREDHFDRKWSPGCCTPSQTLPAPFFPLFVLQRCGPQLAVPAERHGAQ